MVVTGSMLGGESIENFPQHGVNLQDGVILNGLNQIL